MMHLQDLSNLVAKQGPVEIRMVAGKGLGLLACRDLQPGEIAMEEEGLITWPEGAFDPSQQVPALLACPDRHHLTTLMSPYAPIHDENWLNDARVQSLAQSHPDVPPSELARLLLVLETNAFPHGLFPAVAKINHSCRPNCRAFQTPEGRLLLETIDYIKQGEELLISYLDRPVLPSLQQRQRQLEATYLFSCNCPLCDVSSTSSVNNDAVSSLLLEAVACPSCCSSSSSVNNQQQHHLIAVQGQPTTAVIRPNGSCSKCGKSVDPKWLSRTTDRIEEIDRQVTALLTEWQREDEHKPSQVMGEAKIEQRVEKLLEMKGKAQRLCGTRHLLLAKINQSLRQALAPFVIVEPLEVLVLQQQPSSDNEHLIKVKRQKGWKGERGLAHLVEVTQELRPTVAIYLPDSHPEMIELDRLILSLRQQQQSSALYPTTKVDPVNTLLVNPALAA